MDRNGSIGRALVIVIVFVLPLIYVVGQALSNPRIEFLAPSGDSDWALAPDQRVHDTQGGPVSDDVSFSTELRVPDPP